MTEDVTAIIAMTESMSWAQLRTTSVGRIAVIVDDHPDIFPVNFLVDHGSVVFRTAAGTKFDSAVRRPVAFEADGYEPGTGEAWSVVVKGTGRETEDLDETMQALDLPLYPWHPASKPRIVRIVPESISGRRFRVHMSRHRGGRHHRAALE
jgi:uncharacterized protein